MFASLNLKKLIAVNFIAVYILYAAACSICFYNYSYANSLLLCRLYARICIIVYIQLKLIDFLRHLLYTSSKFLLLPSLEFEL